jgi:hypothetical protein
VLRRTGHAAVLAAGAAALAWAGWPGAAGRPATLAGRVDVVATLVMLVVLPWASGRIFGPVSTGRLLRLARAGGCLGVAGLMLAKARAEQSEYAALRGGPVLAGYWAGEITFLLVIAGYLAGLLALTARRPPVSPAVLAPGASAGAATGLLLVALPPEGNPLHLAGSWMTVVHGVARGVAVPLALAGGVAAGLVTARRTRARSSGLPLADLRARRGLAAGLCAGAAAALLVALVGVSVAAVVSHGLGGLRSVLPPRYAGPASVYQFEVSLAGSAAGYLPVLALLPLVGAGLGAWGGLFADGPGGRRADGDGPGGPGGPGRPGTTPAPPGGLGRSARREPAILAGYLLELPGLPGTLGDGEGQPAPPGHRERVPAGAAGTRCQSAAQP